MSPFGRRVLARRLIFIAAGALAGVGFLAARGVAGMTTGAAAGTAIGVGIIAVEQVVRSTPLGDRLRRLPLLAGSLVVSAAYLAVILPVLAVSNRVEAGTWELDGGAIVFSAAVTLVFIAIQRIGQLIGWRILGNVLIGRYRRPIREDRVFLFLDLAGSTGLAERLGEVRAQALIARFYFDIAQPIAAHGGEIYQFRGDEISVTWPRAAGVRDAACVACAFAIRACIAARAERYLGEFGVVPVFRIGLHGGPVVASEVGDQRREIMFFGDTVNVAARLQALCKELGQDVCIGGELLASLALPSTVRATALGRFRLRGREQETEVFGLGAT
jgi:class 3 adenylate cyclase